MARIFLKVTGVTGESADTNHKGWIDVEFISWGDVEKKGHGPALPIIEKMNVRALQTIAEIDASTPILINHCASGKPIEEITLSVCKPGNTEIKYSTIVLRDVRVTSTALTDSEIGKESKIHYSFKGVQVEHQQPRFLC